MRQARIRRLPWCSLRRACRFYPLRRTLCPIPCSALVIKSPYSVPVQKSVDTAVPKPAILLRGRRAFRFGESCLLRNLQPFEPITPDIARMTSNIDLLPGPGFIRALRPA